MNLNGFGYCSHENEKMRSSKSRQKKIGQTVEEKTLNLLADLG